MKSKFKNLYRAQRMFCNKANQERFTGIPYVSHCNNEEGFVLQAALTDIVSCDREAMQVVALAAANAKYENPLTLTERLEHKRFWSAMNAGDWDVVIG